MPTYIQKSDASDISPSWPNTTQFDVDMSAGTGGTGGNAISLTASEIKSASFITVANKPNNDAFEDGGEQTVKMILSGGSSMNIRGRCRMVKLDSAGVIIGVKGAFTAFQTFGNNRTFSPVSPTWTGTEACTHRLAVEWEFENIDTMMTQSVTMATGTATEDVVTDISEDSGGCGAPAGFAHSQAVIIG